MTAVDLITSAYIDACTHEAPHPITDKEAAALLAEYTTEGIPFPPYVTPALFAGVWNIYYKQDAKKGH